MHTNSQSQSALITRLPREILDSIYLELWRSCGLRQHIVWHGKAPDWHFCRWPCTTEYQVGDELQCDGEELLRQVGVPLGQKIINYRGDARVSLYCQRLKSPWLNHFSCGEAADNVYDQEAARKGCSPSITVCLRKYRLTEHQAPSVSSYMSMLLTCKLISAQCLRSIYASTTFVFTDMVSISMFFGFCENFKGIGSWLSAPVPPPGFFQHALSFELSLKPDFPALVPCASPIFQPENPHDVYDYHWLRLGRFQNLRKIDVWISARAMAPIMRREDYEFRGIKMLDIDELGRSLACFESIPSVTLSTPLGPSIGPEEGWVEGVASHGVRLYKRGNGDRFHPALVPFDRSAGILHTSPKREVRVTCTCDHYYSVMEEV